MTFPHNISESWQEKGITIKREHEKLSRLVWECLLVLRLCKLEKIISEEREKLKTEQNEDNLQISIAKLVRAEKFRVQLSGLLGRVVTK
jgi:hypothetical protein